MKNRQNFRKIGAEPEYNKMTNKFFYASLMNIPIFAVPAFAALFLGKFLDNKFETGKYITLGLLLIAFISSWVIVLRNNKKISKEIKEYVSKREAEIDSI